MFIGRHFAALFITLTINTYAMDIYVSPSGNDSAPGSEALPVKSLSQAERLIKRTIDSNKYPESGITVFIDGGTYYFTESLTLGKKYSGSEKQPIIFRGKSGNKPVFNGGKPIDISSASEVKDNRLKGLLNPKSAGKLKSVVISDRTLRSILKQRSAQLTMNGKMMRLARYPNYGYGHIDRITQTGAVYAHGRTKGAPPKYSMKSPIGGEFTVYEKDISPWAREMRYTQKAYVTGYLSCDWYKEKHRIARVRDGAVKLLEYSRYGVISKEKIPRRFYAKNLLCELDSPGEFYFDDIGSTLIFYPFPGSEKPQLTVWGGPPFVDFSRCRNIRFENLVIEGVGKGTSVFKIEDCSNVVLAGCTVRNSAVTAVDIEGGKKCGIVSCDIYDVPGHLQLRGGNLKKLIPSGHFAVNCHFTQRQAADFYGRIGLRGVGQIFRNNLVHNFVGQVMTIGDVDHKIEYNEFFNIGFEEGDGGAIYGGAQMWSWGTKIRYNFLHHLMCLPQAHPRGGIYPDDRDQGDEITRNIFYKAAHRAVLCNGGAGQKVTENVFLQGYIGIYNIGSLARAEKMYKMQPKYDRGELKRGDKMDYIWRTEKAIGKEAWNKEPWKSRFPLFAKIMNQKKRRFLPIECDFSNNIFSGNTFDIMYRTGSGKKDIRDVNTVDYIKSENNRDVSMTIFANPAELDFSYTAQAKGKYPDVRFEKIGLYKDEYRPNPPDKRKYRRAIARKFAGRASYDENARYNPKTINDEIYFNTGKLIK